MCLITLSWQPDQPRPLILASNRDEYYHRPTRKAHFWDDYPHIFGGQDLEAGGTWLGASSNGKLAAITNYRAIDQQSYLHSRGEIPVDFLNETLSAVEFASRLSSEADKYAGFNALLFDGKELVYLNNRSSDKPRVLSPGIYGLSNHLLDTGWPKVRFAKSAMKEAREAQQLEALEQTLLEKLSNTETASENELPDTGVGKALETLLSSVFIQSPAYGTRASTIVTVEAGSFRFTESNYSTGGKHRGTQRTYIRCKPEHAR